ncbi:MAG: T9SS type A sorting domain-containing protein [Bacteroidales bacterium]
MKRVIFTLIAGLFAGTTIFGQCEPDSVNCKDTDEPGQICPMFLPNATVNAYYDEVITVIPPGEVTFGTSKVLINYIIVDSITNLPEGISYAANAERFYADSAYCVQIFGIPVEVGSDSLSIYVTPYIFVGTATIPGPQAVNDTSVVMTVAEASGIDPGQFTDFHLLPNKPNPFSDLTTIGFFTPFDDRIELQVYNILGSLVYEEKRGFPPGEYNFNFDGRALPPGTYFYRVTNSDAYRTGKLIKTKR